MSVLDASVVLKWFVSDQKFYNRLFQNNFRDNILLKNFQ